MAKIRLTSNVEYTLEIINTTTNAKIVRRNLSAESAKTAVQDYMHSGPCLYGNPGCRTDVAVLYGSDGSEQHFYA